MNDFTVILTHMRTINTPWKFSQNTMKIGSQFDETIGDGSWKFFLHVQFNFCMIWTRLEIFTLLVKEALIVH